MIRFTRIKNEQQVAITYWLLCITVLLQITFLCCIIFFTTQFILDSSQASQFLQQVNVVPMSYKQIPVYACISFILLLFVMRIRVYVKESTKSTLIFTMLELGICMFLLWVISFSSNMVLLFVIANMMARTRNKGNISISLVMLSLIFLLTNYSVVSNFIPVTDVQYYLAMYNAGAKSLFLALNNVLSTICIFAFILYMLFLIKAQYDESRKINNLNNELKELNEQLKDYAADREKMGETKERNRLAREIHDTLGHTLTGLSTGLEACKELLEVDQELAKNQLSMLSSVARDGLKDVRRSVNKLRPDALENHSLKEALETMIQEFINSTGVVVYFVCHLSSLIFQQDEEDTIYRIIQEGLTNAVRHGKADKIYISFGKEDDTLILMIEDNGVGCGHIEDGFGLHHMKERVALLNGKVRCYGNEGFVLIVELPLRKGSEVND
ncbi:MAG: sensor histidine kinase [Longicatena sp.]